MPRNASTRSMRHRTSFPETHNLQGSSRAALGRLVHVCVAATVSVSMLAVSGTVAARSKNLAPGFTTLPAGPKVLLAPIDVELFSLSAGGVLEPKADWTTAAAKHMKAALLQRKAAWNITSIELDTATADEHAEMLSLHAAIARAISAHHFGGLSLPTKDGKLDWSFGDALRPLAERTGAHYALFTFVRDSYASPERIAMMVGMALLGIGLAGGAQIGYASLVDLESGKVLWFNELARGSGDLREAKAADETIAALLRDFPAR